MVRLDKRKYGPGLKSALFSQANHNEMWRIHTVLPAYTNPRYNSHFNGYGLGWDLSDANGNLIVGHTGSLPGLLSIVTMYPDLNLGIVILTNTESGGAGLFSSFANTIADSYLGLDDFGWIDKYADWMNKQKGTGDEITNKVWVKVDSSKNTPVKYEDDIGIYEDNWFGKVEVFMKDKQLWIKCNLSPK